VKIHFAIALILPHFFIDQSVYGQTLIESTKLAKTLVAVLDTLTIRLDSSALEDPYKSYTEELRKTLHSRQIEKGFTAQPASAYFRGLSDATTDVQHNRLMLKVSGLGMFVQLDSTIWDCDPILSWILLNDFGVIRDRIAGCEVDSWLIQYQKGYNQVSESVINAYFRTDVVREARLRIDGTIRSEGSKHPEWKNSR